MTDLFSFQPSPQQAAFFDFAARGQGNVALEACAGAGKTTTLLRGLSRIRGTKFLGAFNKRIAVELEKRVKVEDPASHTVTASTLHSAGYATWKQRYPKAGVDQRKTRRLCREIVARSRNPAFERCIDYACDLVRLAQRSGLALTDPRELRDDKRWEGVSRHFDADKALPKEASERMGIRLAQALMERSLAACPEIMTFDEMLYAPIHSGLRCMQYDAVLIDEAQDSNVPQIELAARMLADGGRLFAIGDRHQSIYGFAGADARAMLNIIERFECMRLPLSVSFRCPQAVVLFAQQFVGMHIEPAPDAIEGVARRTANPEWTRTEKLRPDDAILCRFNAPLVKQAFRFLREGVPCRMAGRDDLGAKLKQLAKRWDSRNLDPLEGRLQDWLAEERKIALLRDRPERAATAQDQVETMQILMDRCRDRKQYEVTDLIAEIGRLFVKPDKPALLLSSIHKAKGMEWPRVFWLQHRPIRFAHQQWQQDQENNLSYVAATRAQQELVLVMNAAA